jgi:hypothetical protein
MGTKRTVEGRLFPSRQLPGGWSISIQADKYGYACSPRAFLETIEEYQSVEVAVYGPFPHVVDVNALDLPPAIRDKFPAIEDGHACIGAHLSWSDVETLEATLVAAADIPWAGIPRGVFGWSETEVYLGCDGDLVRDLDDLGPTVLASRLPRLHLERENAGAEGTELVRLSTREHPQVLDLRNAQDREEWESSGLSFTDDDFRLAARQGIEGIYVPEDGVLVVLTPRMLSSFAARIQVTPEDRRTSNP